MIEQKIPIILLAQSSVSSFRIFNPNDWGEKSKAIIQSSSTEYSVIQYCVNRISEVCLSPMERCQSQFIELEQQWNVSSWDLSNVVHYAQIPEMHMLIEAFFSGAKSLLDIIVQLISTEDIIGSKLHGFHKVRNTYGGNVLNSLRNNVCAGKDDLASEIHDFIVTQKELWIDDVIKARHQLIHPRRGTQQLMFFMEVENRNNNLIFVNAEPPYIGDKRIDLYSVQRLENIKYFSMSLLDIFRKK